MPQARRKTPFSGKAKKQQLQSKKQNKTLLMSTSGGTTAYDVVSVNYQPNKRGGRDTNRYALKFYRENDDELRLKKEDALKELRPVLEKDLEVDPADYFPTELSFPKRPPWDFNMSPAQLDAQEQRYFKRDTIRLWIRRHEEIEERERGGKGLGRKIPCIPRLISETNLQRIVDIYQEENAFTITRVFSEDYDVLCIDRDCRQRTK